MRSVFGKYNSPSIWWPPDEDSPLLHSDPGIYAITGSDVVLIVARSLATGTGTLVITGSDAELIRGRFLNAGPGVYDLTGFNTDFTTIEEFLLNASPGSYIITGPDAALIADRILAADPGAYAISGQNALTLAARLLSASPGTVAITGSDTTLLRELPTPSGVVATAGNEQVTVEWSAVTGATSYNIYWSLTTGVTKLNGTKITGATSPYVHTGRTNGTPYFYVVTALNAGGESGDSSEVTATPVASPKFYKIDAGQSHSLALKTNGEIWAWGDNASGGELGDNSIGSKSSPVSVVGNHSFIAISTGQYHSLGLKSNGEVWTWGNNACNTGQLGDNTIKNRSSPVLVVGNHFFVVISGGGPHSLGLKSNGEVWTWGTNPSGQLGDNTIENRSSPVLVVGNHSFVYVLGGMYYSLGLKSTGDVWSWGHNTWGELGDNTLIEKVSPVSVVGGHSFIFITASNGNHSLGLKSTGEVWAWGDNSNGAVGDNTKTNKSSPVLVVGNHSFVSLAAGSYHSLGIKDNGEVWSWGYNADGQLGDNTVDGKSSPVLVVGTP